MRVTTVVTVVLLVSSAADAACNIVNGVPYGNCSGVSVNTGRADFEVVDSYRLLAGVSEGAQVVSGGFLSVSGIADQVIVEQGGMARVSGITDRMVVIGKAYVTGQVNSIQLRDGGHVTVEGIVGGIFGNGTARLEAGSVISGRPTEGVRDETYD